MKVYDRGTLPSEAAFHHYRRTKMFVLAHRVAGPFTVVTREGPVTCQDGWLALDEAGWPYSIAHDEMKAICDIESPVMDIAST